MEIVSVDSGRSGIKVVGASDRNYFKASLGAYREFKLERKLGPEDLVIEYAGGKYFAGPVAAEEAIDGAQMFLASKVHIDTKIFTLAAIHKIVDDGASVFLVSGMPIKNHTEKERGRFRMLLAGSHEIVVNGVKKSFSIVRVEIAAECATVGWSIARKRRDRFIVIDIGSRTINFALFENGKWIDQFSDSLDYGSETVKVSDAQLARMMVADLTKQLRTLPPAILIGGMVDRLIKYIRVYHESTEAHPDALYANAEAFRELGVFSLEQTQQRQRAAR